MDFQNFFTPIEPLSYPNKIRVESSILTIGSCFSSEIGRKLEEFDFNILTNPYGTIFNPISIFTLLNNSILSVKPDENLFVEDNNLWYHYNWHSSVFGQTKEELKSKIDDVQKSVKHYMSSCDFLILTFGSSVVRKYESNIVSNCHKQPSKLFSTTFLDTPFLFEEFNSLYKLIKTINPKIQIITTTSPVRHTKEGIVNNSRSKALLNSFNHTIEDSFSDVHYFPSYEILLDVLRDYRFYKPDLIHPNEQAVDYIWKIFIESFMDENSKQYMNKMAKYLKMKNHKLQHPESVKGKAFVLKRAQLKTEIDLLKNK